MSDPILLSTKEALLHDYGARRCCICQCVPTSQLWVRPTDDTRDAMGVRCAPVRGRGAATGGRPGRGSDEPIATKIGAYQQQLFASGISGLS
jgi:hypothetical protein